MTRLRPHLFLAMAVALALAVTACGKEAGVALPVNAPAGSADTALPDPGADDTGTIDSGTGDTGAGSGSGSGSYDKNRTVALNLQVRVANTYRAPQAADGSAIDVWAGSPTIGGKKLITVPYGQVSAYFAPEVADPLGQGVDPRHSVHPQFLPGRGTDDAAELISQGEDAAAGQKLTFVLGPTDPTDTGARGGTLRVLADDIGSSPKPGGFTHVTLPKAPSGKAVLLMDADALQGRAGLTGTSQGLTPSTADGKCLQYFEADSGDTDYTGALHDMNSSTVDLFGGTQYLVYAVDPGASVRVNHLKENQTVPDACADKPVFGPFDPHLAAGAGSYAFLYGADLASAKVLTVPVG